MHIASLSIRNYRNFESARFKFTKGINTIIGENGSGKTNLFTAIRILLDDSLPRYVKFTESDFNRSIDWAGHWIIITIVFDDLDVSEEAQALAMQSSGHMDVDGKGSYSVFFRPKHQIRKELFDYSQVDGKNEADLKLYLDKITLDDYEVVYLSRGNGDFCDEETYKKYVGDFENIEFPDPDHREESVFGMWLPREINIHNEVSCTYIKALRDVESDLRSYSNNPLVNLLRGKEKSIEIAKQQEIVDSVNSLNTQITALDEVQEVRSGISKSIVDAVGTTYAPDIELKSELPNEMEKLMQSLKLWVSDSEEEDYKGRIWELSLGGANLIYLSLKLLEYEKVKTDKIANFLLIEEPEAHVHTHIQKTLFENLKGSETQVIVSTHSTHISSVSKIRSVNILSRGKKKASVFCPSNNLNSDEVLRLERYLDAVRSNLLFAKGIIMVEGDAEQILLPSMVKTVFGLSLDEIGVSLVNIGSTGFQNVARIFNPDRIQKNCAIITDFDASIVPLPGEKDDDTAFQRHCRNSQDKGIERKDKLDEFCEDNDYVKPFYSNHTFEVDFLMSGNDYEFVSAVEELYKRPKTIETISEKLKDSSVEIAGVEVLRLADKFGKGWFALVVAEKLAYNTIIPNYILEAIAFACSHMNTPSQIKAIRYRIRKLSAVEESAKKFKFRGKSDDEIILEFCDTFPDDQLTAFLNLL